MKKIFFLLSLCLFVACSKTTKQKDLPISREQLKANLKALHLFEASLSTSIFSTDSLSIEFQEQYDSVFAANQINKEDFQTTYYAYYNNYPEELDSIYNELIQELTALKDTKAEHKKEDKLNQPKVTPRKQNDLTIKEEKLLLKKEYKNE